MKKVNLLSRIHAKFALVAVALTSTFFIGCSKENLDITSAGEKATLPDPVCAINVSVLDLANGTTISDATLTTTGGTVSGTTVTLTGSSIAAQTITITASATGYNSGSTNVSIPALTQGQSLSMSAIILMTKASEDKVEVNTVYELGDLDGEWETIYGPEENMSNYCIVIEGVTFVADKVSSCEIDETSMNVSNLEDVETLLDILSATVKTEKDVEYTDTYDDPYHILPGYICTIEKNTYKGSVTFNAKVTGLIEAEYSSDAIPFYTPISNLSQEECSHAGHSHAHGHSHGDDANAGGGIINAVN